MTALKKDAAIHRSVYKLPEVYDLAFSFRDFDSEVTQMLSWFRQYTSRSLPDRAIEFASGPARHAIELARCGVLVDAVDSSAEMCRYARHRASAQGISLEVTQGDIVCYQAPHRYGMALTMIDSIAHLHTEQQLTSHFSNAARMLTDHGIYVLETPIQSRKRVVTDWSVKDEHQSVEVQWHSNVSEKTESAVMDDCIVHFRWTTREGTRSFEHHLSRRKWYPAEIINCAIATGQLAVAGEFGDFGDHILPESRHAARYVIVLQRTQ